MFERFTESARDVVTQAQGEAHLLRHNYIGTEHMLLALLHPVAGNANVLLRNAYRIDLAQMRERVAAIVGRGDQTEEGQIPFSPKAKQIMERGLREALSLGHNYIAPVHLLLGLLRTNEGTAARLLLEHGPPTNEQVIELARLAAQDPPDSIRQFAQKARKEIVAASAKPAHLLLDGIEEKLEDARRLSEEGLTLVPEIDWDRLSIGEIRELVRLLRIASPDD